MILLLGEHSQKKMSQNMEKVQNFLGLRAEFSPEIMQLRGAITKKKRENLGKIPKVGGGGVKKSRRKFPISIWESEKPRGEVSIFQKCLNFSYLIV